MVGQLEPSPRMLSVKRFLSASRASLEQFIICSRDLGRGSSSRSSRSGRSQRRLRAAAAQAGRQAGGRAGGGRRRGCPSQERA